MCVVYGEVPRQGLLWPFNLAQALRSQGLRVSQNAWCLRILDCSHFKLEFGTDGAILEADEDTPEQMLRDASLVSEALQRAGFRHRFEVYSDSLEIAYLHHDWPRPIA